MWTDPIVTVAQTEEPISLAEAKAQCRVDGSDSDTELALYIAAARDYVEKYTGLRLSPQTVTFSTRNFKTEMPIHVAPVQSLTIAYLDSERNSQALATSVYDSDGLNTLRPVIRRAENQSWPTVAMTNEAITVTAVVGYSIIPAAIKQALLLLVSQSFEMREDMEQKSTTTVDALLANYRIFT
ncbi:MAG: head-tail connector protein [Parasphingorhabdus sp.]|uniref:head-tail connector protein n=1 Tax=Sphingomonadales TaxID=204457 RepID=UPI0032630196